MDSEATVRGVMDVVRRLLRSQGLVGAARVSPRPRHSGREVVMALAAPLLAPQGTRIGEVTVRVGQRQGSDAAVVTVEWARAGFGFWFIQNAVVQSVDEEPEAADYGAVRRALVRVRETATGSVPLASMVALVPHRRRRGVDVMAADGVDWTL